MSADGRAGPGPAPGDGEAAPWLADAPLFAAWLRFADSGATPFTIPGHKRRAGTLDPALGRLLDADVPLHGGADTIALSQGVLREAERRAAALWGADACRFSVAGSTHANQVLCLAVGQPGDTVLVGRNAHRSVLSGLVLAGLRPAWLPVEVDPSTGAPLGVAPAAVARALAEHPGAVGLLLTEPAYQGALSDLPRTVELAHAHGVPVLVDQAWGAHLGMAPGYPRHVFQCGADAMVTSAHKMLPAFSQASLVLARHGLLSPDRLDRAFDATHTTSPSAAILASIDAARALLGSASGRAALTRLAADVAGAREQLRAAGLVVPGPEDHPPGRFDPAKLVVHFDGAPCSGLDAEAALLRRGVPVEMADRRTLIAQMGLTDDAGTIALLVAGVLEAIRAGAHAAVDSAVPPADAGQGAAAGEGSTAPAEGSTAAVEGTGPAVPSDLRAAPPAPMTPREAFFAPYETVPRDAALGRTCAEVVAPYPPGVPVLVPGEVITGAALAALDGHRAAGTRIAYAADPTLRTLQVVRQRA